VSVKSSYDVWLSGVIPRSPSLFVSQVLMGLQVSEPSSVGLIFFFLIFLNVSTLDLTTFFGFDFDLDQDFFFSDCFYLVFGFFICSG